MASVSVVLPNFNHARYLPVALDAILTQSLPPLEVLVFDDASTDDSAAVVEAYGRRHPTVQLFRSSENRGPVAWMNRGLQLARGDYVFFSAADDAVLPGFLERSVGLLARHPEAALCSSLSRVIDAAGADQGIYRNPVVRTREACLTPAEALRALMSIGPWFMGNTTVYRRAALQAAGGFDPELRSFCDGFLSQALTLRHGACFIPEALACWRRTGSGFAHADSQQWQQRFRLRMRAAQLMRTVHADAFPPEYVRFWEGECRFAAGVAASRALRQRQREHWAEVFGQLAEQPTGMDRCCQAVLNGLGQAGHTMFRLHLFLRHRGLMNWLGHKLSRLRP